MKLHNIGIALSGGGIRAAVFHLGLFKWLAENNLLEEVRRVSTVSGASLCVGMIYSHNNLKWPTSKEFLSTVLPTVENILLTYDLQCSALLKLIVSPMHWNKKVNVIAKTLEHKWGVKGNLSQLTGDVMWYINCTTYETGKRFRFCKDNMGDYILGYVEKPDISLSDVMAASAGFPIFIGPYSLRAQDYQWMPSKFASDNWKPPSKVIHLWDGGVYDNLGLGSIFDAKNGGTLKNYLDSIIVSNASASISLYNRRTGVSPRNLKRLLDISMDQVTALHSRMVMDYITRAKQDEYRGLYIKIGNSAEKIALDSKCSEELRRHLVGKSLSKKEVQRAMNYPTTLVKPSESDFYLLLQHGYEVTECTYSCYQK